MKNRHGMRPDADEIFNEGKIQAEYGLSGKERLAEVLNAPGKIMDTFLNIIGRLE